MTNNLMRDIVSKVQYNNKNMVRKYFSTFYNNNNKIMVYRLGLAHKSTGHHASSEATNTVSSFLLALFLEPIAMPKDSRGPNTYKLVPGHERKTAD